MRHLLRHKIDVALIALATFAIYLPRPFFSNQNQYLLHAVAASDSRLQPDWLAGTLDTNQFFTRVTTPLFSIAGESAIQCSTYIIFAIGLGALLAFTRAIFNSSLIARIVLLVIAIAQSPNIELLHRSGKWLSSTLVPFQGLGGQYILIREGYIQPSVGAVFLIVALVLLLRNRIFLAAVSAVLATAIHPSLLFSSLALSGLYLLSQWLSAKSWNSRQFLSYLAFATTNIVITFLLNPNYLKLLSSTGEEKRALTRFAFERIPHHTLISHWKSSDLYLVGLWIVAIALAFLVIRLRWLGYFLSFALVISLGSALLVEKTRNTSLALLFPWRLSVVLAPLIFALVIGSLISRIPARGLRATLIATIVVTLPISAVSADQTLHPDTSPTQLESTWKSNKPTGTGFIPISLESLRLELRAPIYVDWKSPPYIGRDLVEWWHRIDTARAIEKNVTMFCDLDNEKSFGWVVWPSRSAKPLCLTSNFRELDAGEYQLFIRR